MSATRSLLRNAYFLDVRAPVEYALGALPSAANLPLTTDVEREQIGIAYARSGIDAAIELGHALIDDSKRRERLAKWRAFADAYPDTYLYCARGGLRSRITQEWLSQDGISVPRVAGGFKSLRRLCIDVLAGAPTEKLFMVVGGRTGCAKTVLLNQREDTIDLEGLANHRGSAFGAQDTPQPTQINFENALATAYLRHDFQTLVLEDESRNMGRLSLPTGWYETMQCAPLFVVESSLEQRCEHIVQEYVTEPLQRQLPPQDVHQQLADSLYRIRRRLGGERHAEVARLLAAGFEHGEHAPWVERLLTWYYDPVYDHQIARRQAHVVWRGTATQVHGAISAMSE